MDKTINISLSGHARPFRLAEDAYDKLEQYLDRATARLQGDPDRAEVMGDLERSIGDKLVAQQGSDDRLVTAADIHGVLEEIGAVDTGHDPVADEDPMRPRARRLQRIREGQQIAGVCNGIAAYSDIRVDWVRTLFLAATVLTAGAFGMVYVALAFILPVVPTRAAFEAERR